MPNPQVVVLDKLDYCASINNLDAVKDCPNFEVREPFIVWTVHIASRSKCWQRTWDPEISLIGLTSCSWSRVTFRART